MFFFCMVIVLEYKIAQKIAQKNTKYAPPRGKKMPKIHKIKSINFAQAHLCFSVTFRNSERHSKCGFLRAKKSD